MVAMAEATAVRAYSPMIAVQGDPNKDLMVLTRVNFVMEDGRW